MAEDQLPYLLGYPASFCETPEEARRNILRMIEAEIPGWDGGAERWAGRLREQLARPNRTRKLNRFGAQFSALEWVWVMRSLLMECERRLPPAAGGSGDRALLTEVAPRRGARQPDGGEAEADGMPREAEGGRLPRGAVF